MNIKVKQIETEIESARRDIYHLKEQLSVKIEREKIYKELINKGF